MGKRFYLVNWTKVCLIKKDGSLSMKKLLLEIEPCLASGCGDLRMRETICGVRSLQEGLER